MDAAGFTIAAFASPAGAAAAAQAHCRDGLTRSLKIESFVSGCP